MLRTFFLSLAVCGVLVVGSCGESDVPSSPSDVTAAGKGSCTVLGGDADIANLIIDLFSGGLENAATQQCNNIERQLGRGKTADAIGKTFNLIGFVLAHFDNGQLDDPAGGDPPTTGEAKTELVNKLLALFGLGPLPGDPTDPHTKTVLCQSNTQCVFTTGNQHAGISATFTEPTLVTIVIREDDPFLLLGVTSFPERFDFSTMSISDAMGGPVGGLALASAPLAEPATVGLCVVDPPHSGAPDEDELANLALGHVIGEGTEGAEVEILPDAPPAGFVLDCTEAGHTPTPESIGALSWWAERAAAAFEPVSDFIVAPLFANPGERRGLISAFSPVAGIDARTVGDEPELIPTTTTLELPEDNVLCCEQIMTATATVVEDGPDFVSGQVEFVIDAVEAEIDPITAIADLDDGEALLDIICDGFPSNGETEVPPVGNFTIQANFLGTATHAASSSETEQFNCNQG